MTRADNSVLQTGYDGNGNVTAQVDGLNHTTSYGYDALNRKSSTTDALNRSTSYAYDLADNLTSMTDAMGRTTSYTYDSDNELVAVSYSDGATHAVSYAYDSLGRRTSMSDGTGSTSYVYDSLSRLTGSTNGAGSALAYGYDLKGQLISIAYPAGVGTVTRTYDDAGRLKTVADWLGHTTTYSYDADSNLTGTAYPNGVAGSQTFDNADRLTGITDGLSGSAPFLSLSYTRDSAGQLTADGAKGYGYDTINRMTTYTNGPSAGITYAYDAADRITSSAPAGGNTTSYAYDNADQLTTATTRDGTGAQVGQLTYGFDANGNRTSVTDQAGNRTALSYDQANRLVSYGSSATYTYNGDGLRMSKTVGGTAEAFTWDTAESLPLIMQDGGTMYVTGRGGLALEQIAGGAVYFFHADQLGSTRALTDATGAVQQTYDYDPYGDSLSASGTVANPMQYAGQYSDAESTYYYLRARFYDPATGQFMSRDPIASTTRESFAYVSASPINRTDPRGLCWGWTCGIQSVATSIGSAAQTAGSAVSSAASAGIGWAADNQDTLTHVATALAIVGVACGLGIVTAETTCLLVGIAALGLGAVQMGIDAGKGDYGALAIDTLGEVTGVAGVRAAAGTARAAFWAFAGLCDARAGEQYAAGP